MIWFGSIDSTTISWNTVIYEFCKTLRELFTAGIAVHKFYLYFICTDVRSQKSHDPWLKCHKNEEKINNDYVLRNDHRIKSILNQFQWCWYYSLQKTMFYLMKSKYAIFSNIKVTKIERSAFFGTPSIWRVSYFRCKTSYLHFCQFEIFAIEASQIYIKKDNKTMFDTIDNNFRNIP